MIRALSGLKNLTLTLTCFSEFFSGLEPTSPPSPSLSSSCFSSCLVLLLPPSPSFCLLALVPFSFLVLPSYSFPIASAPLLTLPFFSSLHVFLFLFFFLLWFLLHVFLPHPHSLHKLFFLHNFLSFQFMPRFRETFCLCHLVSPW